MEELIRKLDNCKWWEFYKKRQLRNQIALKKWDLLIEALENLKKIREGRERYNRAYHIK